MLKRRSVPELLALALQCSESLQSRCEGLTGGSTAREQRLDACEMLTWSCDLLSQVGQLAELLWPSIFLV